MARWLIIGISGVTCGGKSTLAFALFNYFRKNKNLQISGTHVIIGDAFIINQDQYFLPIDDARHKWVEPLKHINWEIITSLDMDKMIEDIQRILKDDFLYYEKNLDSIDGVPSKKFENKKVNILIIEGFLIFNHPQLLQLCQIKFHLHIPYEKCFERRKLRVYNPPDVTGYFEMIVWPMYEKHFQDYCDRDDITMLNGELPKERLFNYALNCISNFL